MTTWFEYGAIKLIRHSKGHVERYIATIYAAYAPCCVIYNSSWYDIKQLEYPFSPQHLLKWDRCSPHLLGARGLSIFISRSNFLLSWERKESMSIQQLSCFKMLSSSVVLIDNQYWAVSCSKMYDMIQRVRHQPDNLFVGQILTEIIVLNDLIQKC